MMLSCEEACRKIASDEYAEAGRWERFQIRFHLRLCGDCCGYARQLREIGTSVRQLAHETQPQAADIERLGNDILARLSSPDSGSDDLGRLPRP